MTPCMPRHYALHGSEAACILAERPPPLRGYFHGGIRYGHKSFFLRCKVAWNYGKKIANTLITELQCFSGLLCQEKYVDNGHTLVVSQKCPSTQHGMMPSCQKMIGLSPLCLLYCFAALNVHQQQLAGGELILLVPWPSLHSHNLPLRILFLRNDVFCQ